MHYSSHIAQAITEKAQELERLMHQQLHQFAILLHAQEQQQALYDALTQHHGFSFNPRANTPGFIECVHRGGVEVAGLPNELGLRIDIAIPHLIPALRNRSAFCRTQCARKKFLSTRSLWTTTERGDLPLEGVLSLVSEGELLVRKYINA